MKRGAVLLLLTACRFGGSNGDALALVEPERDGGSEAEATVPDEAAPAELPPEEHGDAAAPLDATPEAASVDEDASLDAGKVDGCNPPAASGCDPVRNTGCTAGVTQCIVDPESTVQMGRCVFTGLALSPCSESVLSTSCPAQHACVAGQCRKFCYCDVDCEPGSRCSEPIGDAASGSVMLCVSAQP